MVLGYDEKRPSRQQYEDFLGVFSEELRPLGTKGVSLMLYGSYVRGDYVPGRSDIDAVLIFLDDVVISKRTLSLASGAFARAQQGNNIPFQVTVTDLRTMLEGTFNSFGPDFLPYFRDERTIMVGNDYAPCFKYTLPDHSDLVPLRFNLRKCRAGLFFSPYDKKENYTRFLERFTKTLDATSRASKQILHMLDGKLRRNRFSALDELGAFFPTVDETPLERIQFLYTDLDALDTLYRNPEDLMTVWNDSVTFFESLVKAYLDERKSNKK